MTCMQKHKIVLLTVMLILALSTSVFADSFTIKASASPKKGGTISPSGKVTADSGENPQFTITPNTGYQIQDVIVDGVSQGAVNMYTFVNITQKHSIKAKFTKRTFTVMVAQGGKVSVSPIGARTVTYGKKINLKIKPNSEDVVPILLIDGKQVDASQAGNVYKYVLTVVSDTSVYATSAVEPKLTASTKVMDEATAQNLASISADGSVFTFNGITPYLESLQPGDVIVSGVTEATPYGLLRKVTNVTIDGSQITVETTQATLEDAIEEGEIIINQKLTTADIMSFVPLKEGVTLQEGIPGPVQPQACLSLNHVFYDSDGDENTTNDQIALTGSACLDPTFNFALGMGWHKVLGIPVYPELKNLTFSVGLSESIALELVANYTYSFSEKIPIAEIYFEPIVVSYFVFVPMLTVNVGIDGSLSAGITTSVTQNAGLTVGLSYSDGDWSTIADWTSSFGISLPTLHIGAQAKVYAEPRFDLLLYGLVGPYARIQGYFDLRMDPLGDPWLLLYGGIEAGAGIKIGLFGATLADYEFPLLLDYRILLDQLAGNQPPTITSITANPYNVLVGGTSTVTVVAKDPEHDPLTCEWSTSGGTLSSTTGCDPVTWTAPGTLGTANVSVSVKDNKPGRSPVSRSVNIGICSYFSIDPASASYEKEGGSGSVNVTAPSGCAWTATSNDPWITITAGSSGSGNGTVSYAVEESRGSLPRTGTISAGKIFTVTQKGIGPLPICTYGIDPHSATYGSSGGVGSVSVTTQTGCSWDATSNASWITITAGSSGTGNGTVSYTVAANTGAVRNGTMTIGGGGLNQRKTFTVNQESPVIQPPGAPTGLSATDGTYADRVRVTWTAPTTGGLPTGYRIYRYTSNNSGSASEIGTSATTSYNDYAADTNTYWYWVKAENTAGPGMFSNSNSGYRQAALQPPGAPTGLSATDGTYADRVRVTWIPPTTGGAPTGYKVYRYTSNNSSAASEIATSPTTSYDDYAGDISTYWYWVMAYNSAGPGSFSNGDSGYRQAGLQPPGAPTGLSATDGTYADRVRVTWTAPTTGGAPTGYKVYRYTSNNSGSASEIGTSTGTSYDDYAGNTGTYWYWVKAGNSAGPSVSFSNGDSGYRTTPPGAPTGLSATDGTYADRVRVTWIPPTTGATGYRIYRYTKNQSSSASEIGTSTGTSYDDYAGNLKTHWYWVKAYNSVGPSVAFSNGDSGYCQAMTLSVTLDSINSGWGTVTGPGIKCGYGGNDCSETYFYGTSVTLTQTPFDTNNWLTKWIGCDSTDYVTCTVIMNNSRTVTAEFELFSPP